MALPTPSTSGPRAHARYEEALNLYVDGELSFEEQPVLFAHLAACPSCRRTLDAVLTFRRMSRQEHLAVPPGLDDRFYARLAHVKASADRVDRAADRAPLWNVRTPVSLRGVVLAALVVFLVGVLLPSQGPEHLAVAETAPWVYAEDELVEFDPEQQRLLQASAVYVFYPGLTIEADKEAEAARYVDGGP